MATRFSDAQVASYIQNNALSGAGLQQAAQVFQLPPDQIARAQTLLAQGDASVQAASDAYNAAVAGRPDLVEENLSFYNAATGTGSGLANVQPPVVPPVVPRVPPVVPRVPPVVPPVVPRVPPVQPTVPTGFDQAYVNRLLGEAAGQAGGTLSYADAVSAAGRLGIPQRFIDGAMSSGFITEGRTPFANATQGFQNAFNNYSSIPIGAQYNQGVMGGTGGSPYSQIMGQMQPFQNPYAGVIANQPMGGYNPNIYNPSLLSDFMAERAAEATPDGALPYDPSLGGDDGDGPGPGPGPSDGPSAPASPSDFGGVDLAQGGLITNVFGRDPAGPDEGQVNVQRGEYVIRKSAVNKYGKGLLDSINEGKIPAKKIKSLLD